MNKICAMIVKSTLFGGIQEICAEYRLVLLYSVVQINVPHTFLLCCRAPTYAYAYSDVSVTVPQNLNKLIQRNRPIKFAP